MAVIYEPCMIDIGEIVGRYLLGFIIGFYALLIIKKWNWKVKKNE